MPSSLTRGHPSTSVCSTCRPVSVCGTGSTWLPVRLFSAVRAQPTWECSLTITPHPSGYTLGRLTPLGLPPCVPGPFNTTPWYRNLDRLSIAYGWRPRLRPDSPAADDHRCGTLRHSVGRFRTVLALLIPAFALVAPPGLAPAAPSPATTTLPYHWFAPVHGVGGGLSPGTLSAPGHHRPVSYYALFQGWLLLSQPPGCLCARTSLSTQSTLGDLSRWSGLLPSRRRIFAPAVSLRWLARRHSEFGARW